MQCKKLSMLMKILKKKQLEAKSLKLNLWVPLGFEGSQVTIEIMAVHDFSAWGFQIAKNIIPDTNPVVLTSSQDLISTSWRKIS
jgi:hypothetical protein